MQRSASKKPDDDRDRRIRQLSEVDEISRAIESQVAGIRRTRKEKLNLMNSVSLGLYEEVDKLTKKAPAETITDLMLEQVNDVIRDVKELVPEDAYVQRLNEFIAAGDNPQLRDVVIVLRQLRQGLSRFDVRSGKEVADADAILHSLSMVRFALQFFVETNQTPQAHHFRQKFGTAPKEWMTDGISERFDWAKLDRTPLPDQFFIVVE